MELDQNARHWLDAYVDIGRRIADLTEQREQARANLEQALGADTEGTVDGRRVVTWTPTTAIRIDAKKVKALLPPELLQAVQTESTSRRLVIVKDTGQ